MEPTCVHIAVLAFSEDPANPDLTIVGAVVDLARGAGHRVVARAVVADAEPAIREQLGRWIAAPEIDVVIATGELESKYASAALRPLISQQLPGFTDLFRYLAFQEIGTSAMLSNAEAARCDSTFVFVLPATVAAARAAMDRLILPQLDSRTKPRNLVSELPRLRTAGAVPSPIVAEKTASGSGMLPKLPAIPRIRRTSANVIARHPQDADPTKEIELQRLEHQLALSAEPPTDAQTKRVDVSSDAPTRRVDMASMLPPMPPGADDPDDDDMVAALDEATARKAGLAPRASGLGPRAKGRLESSPRAATPAAGSRARPIPSTPPQRPAGATAPPRPAPSTPRPLATPVAPPTAEAPPVAKPPHVATPPSAPAEPALEDLPEMSGSIAVLAEDDPPTPAPDAAAEPPPPAAAPPTAGARATTPPRTPPTPAARPTTTPPVPPTAAARPTTPPPIPVPIAVERTEDVRSRRKGRRSPARVVARVLVLALAAVAGFFAVVHYFPRVTATSAPAAGATPTTPPPAAIDAAAAPTAVATAAPDAAPAIEMERAPDAAPPAPAREHAHAAAPIHHPARPAPQHAHVAASAAHAAHEPAHAGQEPAPAHAAAESAPEATGTPDAGAPQAAAAPGCDEVSCVLDKYARPCCARYKPAGPGFEPAPTSGTPDRLDREMVKAGMERIKPRVIDCGAKSTAKGTVRVAVTVGGDGAVHAVEVQDTPDPALGACVARAIRAAKFAKSTQGASFVYPFVF